MRELSELAPNRSREQLSWPRPSETVERGEGRASDPFLPLGGGVGVPCGCTLQQRASLAYITRAVGGAPFDGRKTSLITAAAESGYLPRPPDPRHQPQVERACMVLARRTQPRRGVRINRVVGKGVGAASSLRVAAPLRRRRIAGRIAVHGGCAAPGSPASGGLERVANGRLLAGVDVEVDRELAARLSASARAPMIEASMNVALLRSATRISPGAIPFSTVESVRRARSLVERSWWPMKTTTAMPDAGKKTSSRGSPAKSCSSKYMEMVSTENAGNKRRS